MALVDPATGTPLPSDAIQRVLFVAAAVHVYQIPPLSSMRGHSAASWTTDESRHIFTARLRVIETCGAAAEFKVDVVLEDPASGQLFAAAPYMDEHVVEPAVDSSRFFAVAVRDPNGRRAVLGIGFQERSDAFDLSVALQEARRNLGWADAAIQRAQANNNTAAKDAAKDYSLKDGETITVSLGKSNLGRRQQQEPASSFESPPIPLPPPPPSAQDARRKRRSLQALGFDDGQFGEFA
ncbi:hypothetical protein L249_4040 [Ophiocordyceps polyrhachis-furcata BCC 54312]|uniref:NECAP PHear domain-containing protein n=1 Tax=Ophiocordyceps polyrhachis-furcata BCC 54312 TaxID=1330021 RepID=A0A367L550_9HYPO|nr:hypothetical protein L249_4040 [Ophiocordyceps polyrhachis-furcata BCC 54312]